jgi:4-hydroxybenzoate polyprenyltransferase
MWKDIIQVSRPGLWLVFIWLYIWPTGGNVALLQEPIFWTGMVYCTLPLNLLVYGMNDLVDEDVDIHNPRKGNYIYGAKLKRNQLRCLPLWIAVSNIIPLCMIVWMNIRILFFLVVWLLCAIGVNMAYNYKPLQLSRKCPYEIPTMIIGHLMIPILTCEINYIQYPSLESWVFHVLLLARSHIWLEYADIDVDSKEGKRTVAVVLGPRKALELVILLTLMESFCGFILLGSNILGLFSIFGAVVFLLASRQSSKTESNRSVALPGDKLYVSISQSVIGAVLMVYLWIYRILV